MKILTEFPPNYAQIQLVFKEIEKHKPIFCYGDTIYNPFKREITPDLDKHEEVHSKQQGLYPDQWWGQYLNDRDFRLQQEIEAYGTQYAFVKSFVKNTKLLEWLKENMADALSGELYGNLLSYGEAESKIRNYAKSLKAIPSF